MPPKIKKTKPLTQKAEREMMGAEDIASTARELTDAQKRMAKAREAKKAKAVAPKPKESITMTVKEEAPYGYTASGRKRTKPLKEKAPKAPKAKAPKAPKAKAPKAPKAKKVYPPPSTAREQIGMVEEDLDARLREKEIRSKPKPKLEIKVARRYIQLLEKGKDILMRMVAERGSFWTQDGYYTTVGDKSVDEIIGDLEETYEDFVDVFREAKVWFKDTYDGKRFDSPIELRKSDEKIFEPESFGLSENRYYDPNTDDYDDEFNGEYHLGDYTDLEEGISDAFGVLKEVIDLLKVGGFVSPIEIEEDEEEEEEEEEDESPRTRSSSVDTVGLFGEGLKGGALSAKELKGLLGASYDPKTTKVGDFVLDSKLSTSTSKVYHNAKSGQTVVAHKGTEGLLDWGNNAVYALGGKTAYKMTPRYKEAEKVQKKAEAKYGKQNISTIGHSQGGLQAELLGGKSKEIITLNKATRPFESNKNKNQYDVRSSGDVVSALNPFEKKSSKNVEIQRGSYNPLKEHSGDILDRLKQDTMIGGAIRRVIEGGATPDQRAIAGVLRSRLRQLSQTHLGSYRDVKIKNLLNAILHSTDTEEDFDDFARMNPTLQRNPYVDYTDTYDYVIPDRNVPLPSKVIDDALRAFYSFMTSTKDKKYMDREFFTKTIEAYKSGIPDIDRDRDLLTFKIQQKEGKIVEPTAPPTEAVLKSGGGGGSSSETASTTSDAKAEKKRLKRLERIETLRKKAEEKRLWWLIPTDRKFEPLGRMLDALLRSIIAPKIPSSQEERQDTFNQKFEDFKKEWEKLEKEILDDVNAIFKITNKDGRITMADLVDYGYTPVGYKIVLDRKFDAVPMDSSQQSVEKRRTYGLIKNPYDAELEKRWKQSGKGLPIPSPIVMGGAIDFEDMNWGSLTEQMKAYNSQHKKDFDLERFARMIVAKPSDFQKRTLKRARFYLNVLLPKKKS